MTVDPMSALAALIVGVAIGVWVGWQAAFFAVGRLIAKGELRVQKRTADMPK